MSNTHQSMVETLSRPFIEAGLYESEEAFLKDVASDLAQRRIKTYRAKIRKFERKHQSWEKFTEAIQGQATAEQEDEWMEWEGARNMLSAWQELQKELT